MMSPQSQFAYPGMSPGPFSSSFAIYAGGPGPAPYGAGDASARGGPAGMGGPRGPRFAKDGFGGRPGDDSGLSGPRGDMYYDPNAGRGQPGPGYQGGFYVQMNPSS